MPNLLYVARKLEPLGTEFKTLVEGLCGNLLWLEVQEGKHRMNSKKYQELGGTDACVMGGATSCGNFLLYMVDSCDDGDLPASTKLFFGDSWFGSVNSLAALQMAGHHGCFIVKTLHSRTPKKFIEETVNDFPGGTWITLTGKTERECVDLVCIGFKYNKKTVLTFLCTRGAGRTTAGEPYEARFPEKFGNLCVRHVARPAIISKFFKYSNCVDLHNQARQFDLALEKNGSHMMATSNCTPH